MQTLTKNYITVCVDVTSWREGGGRHLSPRDKDEVPSPAALEPTAAIVQNQGQPLAVPPVVNNMSAVRPAVPPFVSACNKQD